MISPTPALFCLPGGPWNRGDERGQSGVRFGPWDSQTLGQGAPCSLGPTLPCCLTLLPSPPGLMPTAGTSPENWLLHWKTPAPFRIPNTNPLTVCGVNQGVRAAIEPQFCSHPGSVHTCFRLRVVPHTLKPGATGRAQLPQTSVLTSSTEVQCPWGGSVAPNQWPEPGAMCTAPVKVILPGPVSSWGGPASL